MPYPPEYASMCFAFLMARLFIPSGLRGVLLDEPAGARVAGPGASPGEEEDAVLGRRW